MPAMRLTPQAAQAWGLALGFGWRIAAGAIIGYWIDEWQGTTPIFITVLSIGALVGAVADMLRISKRPAGPGAQDGADDDASS